MSTQELRWAEVALFAVGGPLFPGGEEKASLPDAVVRRPGHRRGWIADALGSAQRDIDPATYKKLSHALTLLLGIDPVVVMTDIAGASRKEALDALEWTARTLVEAALDFR